jgi:hypothetical protein
MKQTPSKLWQGTGSSPDSGAAQGRGVRAWGVRGGHSAPSVTTSPRHRFIIRFARSQFISLLLLVRACVRVLPRVCVVAGRYRRAPVESTFSLDTDGLATNGNEGAAIFISL